VQKLGADCTLFVLRLQDRPAAVALLTHYRDRTEIPWSASLSELRKTSINVGLYWECLQFAIARPSRYFDFGRCSVDSGTYDFKVQWGGKVRQLYWVYPLLPPDSAAVESHGSLRTHATTLWARLPAGIATRLGSMISPGLPW
jgi:hypothetical protein